jgi:hypothetical protein
LARVECDNDQESPFGGRLIGFGGEEPTLQCRSVDAEK